MTIELPPDLAERITRKIDDGEFETPVDVVRDALEGRDASEVAWLAQEDLHQAIATGLEEANRGELIPADVLFRELDELNARDAAR